MLDILLLKCIIKVNKGKIMGYFLLGVLIGWLVPRPKIVGKAEAAIWNPIKSKLPKSVTKHFG